MVPCHRNPLCTVCLSGWWRPVAVLAAVWGIAGCSGDTPDEGAALRAASEAMERGDFPKAIELAAALPEDHPDRASALLIAGDAAHAMGDPGTAARYYDAVPKDGSTNGITAAMSLAEIHFQSRSLTQAVAACHDVIRQQRNHIFANSRLSYLYAITGQRTLAADHQMRLLGAGEDVFRYLVLLTDVDRHPDQQEFVADCVRRAPDDPLVILAQAVEDLGAGRFESARDRLERVVSMIPDNAAAQAMLGEQCLNAGGETFLRWYTSVPESIRDDAQIWFVCGLWLETHNNAEGAARSFWETLRRAEVHPRATYHLGQTLTQLNDQRGREFLALADAERELSAQMSVFLKNDERSEAALRRFVELLLEMGRVPEAWAWTRIAATSFRQSAWPSDMLNAMPRNPSRGTPRVAPADSLSARFDLSSLPDHRHLCLNSPVPTETDATDRSTAAAIRFVDHATELGISHSYHQGSVGARQGVRIFESTGGGVAVLDFDLDALPDLYFTQGEDWPAGASAPSATAKYADALYRNRGTGFADVGIAAAIAGDDGYGQGCTAGDFNNDGFPDLYVANIGRNRLWLNQGDGTFLDITEEAGVRDERWTTSCLIADLNADGIPDLFDVNYLEGDEVFQILCHEAGCSMSSYRGAQDQVFIGRGDNAVIHVPDVCPTVNAKGLGVIGFRPEGSSRLSLFVANDQVPNHFLKNDEATNEANLRFSEDAFVTGLAVNAAGLPTACMGVAAGDVNEDGLVDLFVTNFSGEANTLYVQQAHGLFSDLSGPAGLFTPGLPYVGWGTQFLDAENDGDLDLVVTNGHVANFALPGNEYLMRSQFLENLGHMDFVERPAGEVGPFFDRRLLGRALTTVDWNGDGRQDFVVTAIQSPAAVLTNVTEPAGNFLDVVLHGTRSARDAFGAEIELIADGKTIRRQQIAGSGYQCSNERVAHFGLGHRTSLDQVTVRWPSSMTTSISAPRINSTLHIVEGRE